MGISRKKRQISEEFIGSLFASTNFPSTSQEITGKPHEVCIWSLPGSLEFASDMRSYSPLTLTLPQKAVQLLTVASVVAFPF